MAARNARIEIARGRAKRLIVADPQRRTRLVIFSLARVRVYETVPSPAGRLAPNPPGSELRRVPAVWGCRARRNLRNKRLNGRHILGHVLAVTVEYPPSDIRMLSTDKDVTAHVGAWIVVNMRPATRPVGNLNVAGGPAPGIHVLGVRFAAA